MSKQRKDLFKLGGKLLLIGYAIATVAVLAASFQTSVFLFVPVLVVSAFMSTVMAATLYVVTGYNPDDERYTSRFNYMKNRAERIIALFERKNNKQEKKPVAVSAVAEQ